MNPYKRSELRRLKRSSKLRYGLALLLAVVPYLFWQLSRLIPQSLGKKIRRFFAVVLTPFRGVIQFVQVWLVTRPWKKLWLAAPIILLVAALTSTLYLATNQTDEDVYKEYKSKGFEAMEDENYSLANFLFGKIIDQPEHQDDAQLLYQAMIAASEDGNQLRAASLQKRLTEDLDFPAAHMWVASRYLASSDGVGAAGMAVAVRHVTAALNASDDAQKGYIQQQQANLYMQSGQYTRAIRVLLQIKNPPPRAVMMLADCYLKSGSKTRMIEVCLDLLSRLNHEDPQKMNALRERVFALSSLASVTGTGEQKKQWLEEAVDLLERRAASDPDNQAVQSQLASVYLRVTLMWLQNGDEAWLGDAFESFDRCVHTGHLPSGCGDVFLLLSNIKTDGRVTVQKMESLLIEGRGTLIAHMLLGLNAWKNGDEQTAIFHLKMAHAQNPQSLEVLKLAAIALAGQSSRSSLNLFTFSLQNTPLWKHGLLLLEMLPRIDASFLPSSLMAQCSILANQQLWLNIPPLLESKLEHIPEEEKEPYYRWLILAYQNLGDRNQIEKYKKLLDAAMADE